MSSMFAQKASFMLLFFQLVIWEDLGWAVSPVAEVQSVPVDAKEIVKNRVSCYVCNSANRGEADCEGSDLDKLQPFIKQCPPLSEGPFAGSEASSCRKVHQTVGDETSIVRECAYTGTEPVDGKRRTGNKGITLYLYQCFNEEQNKPCNSAHSPALMSFLSTMTIVFLAVLLI